MLLGNARVVDDDLIQFVMFWAVFWILQVWEELDVDIGHDWE